MYPQEITGIKNYNVEYIDPTAWQIEVDTEKRQQVREDTKAAIRSALNSYCSDKLLEDFLNGNFTPEVCTLIDKINSKSNDAKLIRDFFDTWNSEKTTQELPVRSINAKTMTSEQVINFLRIYKNFLNGNHQSYTENYKFLDEEIKSTLPLRDYIRIEALEETRKRRIGEERAIPGLLPLCNEVFEQWYAQYARASRELSTPLAKVVYDILNNASFAETILGTEEVRTREENDAVQVGDRNTLIGLHGGEITIGTARTTIVTAMVPPPKQPLPPKNPTPKK